MKKVKNSFLTENDECLYVCESIIDSDEYKKMVRYFPQFYWYYVFWGTVLNLIVSAIIAISFTDLIGTLEFLFVFQIFIMIIYKVRLEYYALRTFEKLKKQGNSDGEIHSEFYSDYFIRQSETTIYKINYAEIGKFVETDTNIYLKWDRMNLIIFLQKNKCDPELIDFIREKFGTLNVKVNKKRSNKSVTDPTLIQKRMNYLFVLTIMTVFFGILSFSCMDRHHYLNQFRDMWIFWCWIPIPLLSIILGFKYRKLVSCTKNIVVGFIVGVLLFVLGCFSLVPSYEDDYNKIDAYREIVDVELPDEGELFTYKFDSYFDDDKKDYTIVEVFFDKNDSKEIVTGIEKSDNWILGKNVKSKLKLLLPAQLYLDDEAYFSIYNKTTQEYNTLPDETGEYEIYAMKYDKSERNLNIYKFSYSYR